MRLVFARTGSMAAAAAAPEPRILWLSWALLVLLAALLHSASPAAPEKEVPNRPLRARLQSSPDRPSLRWRPPYASGLRSPRRYPGYLMGYGESSRKMSYKPLPKEEQRQEMKKLASESVYVVSLQSRNPQGQSQSMQRAALTKRKVAEEEELEEAKDITVRVMSSQSVLVTWTDPIYEKQKKAVVSRQYTVRYREKGESARWDYKQVPNRRVLVDKLIPDTMYEFAVRISQGEKEGKWSASVYQRTPEAAPTSAPENLDVVPIKGKATSVAATWDALSESEGRVKEYILSYAPALKPFGAKSITYPGDTTSTIVDGLQPGERYIFKIRAANRRGQGPQSKAFSVVLPTTHIDQSKVDQQTNAEEELESKTSENTVPSPPFQTSSTLSQNRSPSASSKHASGHSSSFPGGGESKNSVSDIKHKLSAGSGIPKKSQLPSRKGTELKNDSHSTEDTGDQNSSNETPTTQPKTQDNKSSVRPHPSVKSSHSIISSSRTPFRSRTPVRTGQTGTDKQRSSPSSSSSLLHTSSLASSSIPKYTENEKKTLRKDVSNLPSSPKVTLDNPPVDNESNDEVDSTEEKQIMFPKTPEDPHLILHSNQQPPATRKVVQSHPTKLLTPSVSTKSSASSAATSSQSHFHHPSYKLVPSDTTDILDSPKSKEAEKREQKTNSRPFPPQAGSSPSKQTKPLSPASRQTLRDPRVVTSAVSAAATHTLPRSHGSSAKYKPDGRDDSDYSDNEKSEREGEENRRGSSSFRPSFRSSSSQPVSERFNLFKYRSALTTNRLANKAGSIHNTRIPPSKAPSSTQSSKLNPQANSHLTSSSRHNPKSNIDKELEDEDESPLPSTLSHGYSPSFSRQWMDYSRRRSSVTESRNPHRVPPTDKSTPTNTYEENLSKEREDTATKADSSLKVQHSASLPSASGQSPSSSRTNGHSRSSVSHPLTNGQISRPRSSSTSTDSFSRTSVEKSSPLQSSASRYQPDDLESKDVSPKSKQTSSLSKKTVVGRSHALSHKNLQPETSRSQKAVTDQSQHQPSLNSRSHHTVTALQSNENLEDRDNEHLEENYYQEAGDKEEQRGSNSESLSAKDVSTSWRISTSLSKGRSSSLSKHSNSQTSKSGERPPTQRDSLTSSRGLSLSPRKHIGSKVIASSEDVTDGFSHQSKHIQPGSTSVRDPVKDHQYNRETSLRQTHHSVPRYTSGSRVPTQTASQTDKKHGLLQPVPTKVELSPKMPSSKVHQSLSNDDDDYEDYDQSETEENPTSSSATIWPPPSISKGSKSLNNNVASDKTKLLSSNLSHKARFANAKEYKQEEVGEEEEEEHPTSKTSNAAPSGRSASVTSSSSKSNKLNTTPKVLHSPGSSSVSSHLHPTRLAAPTRSSSSPSEPPKHRIQNSRLLNPSQRQQARFPHRQGNGGRPNLTTKLDLNHKITSGNNEKRNGQRVINGPQGIKWIVDLDRGLVLNVEGRYLQDSQGKPLRIKLGGDGRTIVDSKGAPVVSPDGLPLFGHGRFSKPVANAQDKPIISLGGKPLIGLEMVKKTTTPSTTTATTVATTTTTTTTTTTPAPTTTEPPTEKPLPTCPPDTYADYDEEGNLVLGLDGLPVCNSEDTFSGLDADVTATTESYVIYDEDYEFFETTLPPSSTTTTEALSEVSFPEFSVAGTDPLSEYDAAGKKRFTAPYVTYLNKDPAAPCSLTDALDHFQVESLDEIIPHNLRDTYMRPQKAPHNITIVAVEGCHSFVIVDWAKPIQGDLVTGYLVYSASYDDFIRNKWSTKTAGSTNLPIENLKPNTRYYFKVQANNPYGYGPISSSVSYVTESDNPLLIVRPPENILAEVLEIMAHVRNFTHKRSPIKLKSVVLKSISAEFNGLFLRFIHECGEPIWIPFTFKYDPTYSECSGKQYVKRTWYRKFVGVVLCNSLRYKIYLSDDLRDTFYSIGDSWGRGEDHCQFVDSHLDGRTGPQSYVEALPPIQGYYRQYRQEPVSFGRIGYMTPYYYVGWYECGVPIPGKW